MPRQGPAAWEVPPGAPETARNEQGLLGLAWSPGHPPQPWARCPGAGGGRTRLGLRTQGRLCPSTWPGGPAPQTAPGPRMPPGTLTPPPPEPCWVFPALVPYAEVLLPPADRLARGPASLAAAQPLPAGPGPPLSAKLPDHVLPRVDHSPQSSQLPPQDGQADLASPPGSGLPSSSQFWKVPESLQTPHRPFLH